MRKKPIKKQIEKAKRQTTITVPNKTLKIDQCRYCKETGHMMADCPKLAKRRKLEEDPDAQKCPNCNTQDMMNKIATLARSWKIVRLNRLLQKHRKRLSIVTNKPKNPIKPKMERQQPSSSKDLN